MLNTCGYCLIEKMLSVNTSTWYVVNFGCECHAQSLQRCYGVFCFPYSLQELPRLLSSMAPLFNLRGCTYKIQKSKEAAARVVVWRMGVVRSYTMEASYCGASIGRCKVCLAWGEGGSRGCRGDTKVWLR